MKQIRVYQNFNGMLFNDCFSYLAPHTVDLQIGQSYELVYRSLSLGVVEAKALRSVLFCRLSEVLSHLCCGRELHYLSALLNRQFNGGETHRADAVFTHAVLGYNERNIENQRSLLKEWWAEKESDYYTLNQ